MATEREALALEQKRARLAAEAAAAAALAAQQAQLSQRTEAVSDARVSYGLTLVGGSERPSFAAQRGFLALPVAAATSISPVDPVAGGRRQGLHFETPPGASVRAAAAGRVAAVERTENGVTIALDHGDGYRTVYSGLADSDLEINDAISKSARVGSAGSRPVRFEVRRGSRSQDARSFLGL
jgi:murein DD-endopeptidase MepM/ murein hydrolase activator NlpD